jgi:hypothetical protein
MVGDYWPDKVYRPGIELWKQFDALLPVNMDMLKEMSQYTKTFPYLNTYEEPNGSALPQVEEYDIVFLGHGYSQARRDLWALLDRLRGKYKVGLFGRCNGIRSDGVNHYKYDEGRAIYKKAKLAISTNEFNATGYTSNRYFEITASGGAMCLHQTTPKLYTYTGARAGSHYIQWDNLQHLEKLINNWLAPNKAKQRKRIAASAYNHTTSDHCGDARVKYVLTDIVPKLAGNK